MVDTLMKKEEALSVAEACSTLYPPTNMDVLMQAGLVLWRENLRDEFESVMRWAYTLI